MEEAARDPSQVKSRGVRRRLRLLMVLFLCFMGWAGVTLWDQMVKVDAKDAELERLEQRLADTVQDNEAYQHEITRLNDPEYLEQLIRKDLNMTKDGETLYIQTE